MGMAIVDANGIATADFDKSFMLQNDARHSPVSSVRIRAGMPDRSRGESQGWTKFADRVRPVLFLYFLAGESVA
jgi:hypothetical protein